MLFFNVIYFTILEHAYIGNIGLVAGRGEGYPERVAAGSNHPSNRPFTGIDNQHVEPHLVDSVKVVAAAVKYHIAYITIRELLAIFIL